MQFHNNTEKTLRTLPEMKRQMMQITKHVVHTHTHAQKKGVDNNRECCRT